MRHASASRLAAALVVGLAALAAGAARANTLRFQINQKGDFVLLGNTLGQNCGPGVPAPLVDVLDADGITAPFPVQAATLPDALAGRDILGRAQTGSGKTLAFSLPLVSRLAGGSTLPARPRGLVLVPTRELAIELDFPTAIEPVVWGMVSSLTSEGIPLGPAEMSRRPGDRTVFYWLVRSPALQARYRIEWRVPGAGA